MNNRFYPDWQTFAYKYQGQENERFEDLARILLCKELGIEQGLFQRVNHKGNESSVIEIDGKVIGFQAKYFKNGINAKNIINSMRKAKEDNPNQTHYYIYCNQAFGNPRRRKGFKKTDPIPDRTIDEEKIISIANELSLVIVWKLDKVILDEVATEKWICDVFFNVNGKLENLVKEEKRHAETAFNSINYSCLFNNKEIHIQRDEVISDIRNMEVSTICVIHGDGGCGKTAVLHEFFDHFGNSIPICYRKATTLNVKKLKEVFHQGDDYSFADFKEAFSDCKKKYFIIDSAEHLDEMEDGTIVPLLLKGLLEDHWNVIFTVRNVYVSDLLNLLSCELGKVNIIKKEIGLLTEIELNDITIQYGIRLPNDRSLVDRIRNLFYLNLYLNYYNEIDGYASDSLFLKLVWDKKIKGKDGRIGYIRENEFEAFIKDRMKSGSFFLSPENYTSEEFYSLVDDEIVAIDPINGLFITHDIFEEWGMYRIVEKQWQAAENVSSFLTNLGDTRAIRRTFRLWLKDRASENPDTIKTITKAAFSGEMVGLWKDEVVCALLLTDKSAHFFAQYEDRILDDQDEFANRIIWALRVGCLYVKSVFEYKDYYIPQYAPVGSGWGYIIDLLYRHQDKIKLSKWLPVLCDWSKGNCRGETTRKVGLITIAYYQSRAFAREQFNTGIRNLVHEILNNTVFEVKTELASLLHKCITDDELSNYLPEFVLGENAGAWCIHMTIPQQVIELCLYYWREHEEEGDERAPYYSRPYKNGFGIDEYGVAFKYFPPGADQTPTSDLLLANETLALDFIIRLMNESVDIYARSKNKNTLVKVDITDGDGNNNWQWHSETLWGMYREIGSPVAPYCLMSVHMALERYLLNLSKEGNFAKCKAIMHRLLFECHSSSVSAVVGSLVLAYPNEYWQEALILFKVLGFIQTDGQRAMMEEQTGSLYGLSSGLNSKVDNERMETTKQEFRQKNLEGICLSYQCFGSNVLTKNESEAFIQQIYKILDEHRKLLDEVKGDEGRLLEIQLSRMDRRRLKISGQKKTDKGVVILFDTELNEETRKISETAIVEHQEMIKYLGLFNWAYAKMRGETSPNPVYEKNVDIVFDAARLLEAKLNEGGVAFLMDANTLPWVSACLLKFHKNELSVKQLEWCRGIIERNVTNFKNEYGVMDGAYACIQVIPVLIELFPKEKNKYAKWLFQSLLIPDHGNVSASTSAIDAVKIFALWDKESHLMKNILNKYDQYVKKETLQPHHLKIVLGLIPDKPDQETTVLAVHYLKQIPQLLAKNEGTVSGMFDVLDVLARLFIKTNAKDIINCLSYTQAIVKERYLGSSFLAQLIVLADRYKNPDRFWEIWNAYRSVVHDLVNQYDSGQLKTYTLNIPWNDGVKEWHSLRKQDIGFFEYLAENCEGNAIVFEGIVKLMTTVGYNYRNEGIGWLAIIIKHHPDIDVTDTVSMRYLELVMLQYIYANKMQIRKRPNLLADVRAILNFMVSRSSVTGYMLRDMIN